MKYVSDFKEPRLSVANYDGLVDEIERIDQIIAKKYLNSESRIPETSKTVAYLWLENDISAAFYKSDDIKKEKASIKALINESPYSKEIYDMINFDRAYKSALISKNWSDALDSVKSGCDLSYTLGWGFSCEDITELAKLHMAGKHRQKIEDLLEDCNFHYECGKFADGEYEEFI